MKMPKILSSRLVLFVSVLALCAPAKDVTAKDSSQPLVSSALLEHAKLRLVWQNKLPIKKKESLERLLIVGDRIYALSNRNYMVSLDRESGDVIFSKPVAPAGFAVLGLELYQDELISVIGNKLVEMDLESGQERRTTPLEFGVVCPAARNSSYFYLSGADRRLRALRAENKVQVFEVAAENASMITSIISDEHFVIFGTDAGNVISITPDKPKRLWQFDATDTIAGPIVRDGPSLFFANKDTNVYRLDMLSLTKAELIWKYQMPGILTRAPRVTWQVVYQYAGGKGLTAIDKRSGEALWSVRQGVDLLADAGDKAYVITDRRTLLVMDNIKLKRLYWVNFAQVSRYAVNTIDSRIYIADERGRVACLEPVE